MTGTRYAADPPSARIVAELDTLTAIFHRPSGVTHLLSSPAPELLEALGEGPADAATLLGRLAGRFDVADADLAALEARLQELVAVGLAFAA